ncbi:glycosyltransferase family 4 protein [Streptococcus catagoni]|uniref:glycosyltransferase family 4 protein n=1 Tax=Streptococcus catagoni TaxID=2654874 RepID=UPI00140D2FDF|nr:glycosyltransferase family 4 protein [Streptococcus catagoni]
MKTRKTIVFFSGYFLPFLGGIERYTDKLTNELVKLGYDIIIVTSNHDHLPDFEEDNHRRIYRLPTKDLFKQRYPIIDKNAKFKELYAQLENEEADYVICNTRFQLTTPLGLAFAKKKKIPSLVLDHGSSHFTVNNKLLDVFGAFYEHLLTAYVKSFKPNFFAVSHRSSDWLKHFHIETKGVIYNSVSEDLNLAFKDASSLEKDEKDIYISYAGRILREKGVEMLVRAFSAAQFPPHIHLQIAGDGPLLAELQAQNKNANIHFLGKLNFDQTMALMSQTDIFVYPSMYPEGLPTSILEAGLLGCAIIATDRGGTTEVITDRSLGIIIEENEGALQSALEELVNHPDKRNELKRNIQKRIKDNFVWEKTAKKLVKELFP